MTNFRGLIDEGICLALFACNKPVQIRNVNLLIEVNDLLETRVHKLAPGAKHLMSDFSLLNIWFVIN